MDIRNRKSLKTFAAQRLDNAPQEKRIVLIYAGITIGLTALVTIINYILGLQIDNYGGLRNMSIRTFLSATQTVLPLAQSVVLMCLDVGYLAAMLRIARGQYSSPNTLRLGFDRFWVLLRSSVLRTLMYFASCFAGVYFGILIYVATPLSNSVMEVLAPLVSDTSILDSGVVIDDATYNQLVSAMWPAFLICGVLCLILLPPIYYNYRMTNYVIIDRPGMGALAAMRESKKMMKGNRLALFRLDLSMWWYYAAMLLASVVCYGDLILPMLGVTFPWSEDVSYFLFYALYLALLFAITYFLQNRVHTTYGLAYDAIKPEEKKDNSVVLGNIFQM